MAEKEIVLKKMDVNIPLEKSVQNPKILTEERYSVQDFCKASMQLFGVTPECVIAAFFVAKKDSATENEAKKIITDFMKKEIK